MTYQQASTRGSHAKITDEMVEDLRKEIGKEYPAKEQWNTVATKDAIRHYAEGCGDLNPLWLNEEYAKKTRYGGIIAQPTFLYSCIGRAGRIGMPGIHALHGGTRWLFYSPTRVNDEIKTSGGLHDIICKNSSLAHRAFHQWHFNNFRDSHDRLLATRYDLLIRHERDASAEVGKYTQIKASIYTEEELQRIWREIEAHERRGATPRFWEDVEVGEELGTLVKGPLVLSDVVAFKMGWGSHTAHHIRANETRYWMAKRHPGMTIRNRLNVPDCPEGVHMLSESAMVIGIPGFYDYGAERISWAGQLMTDWIGDDGWLKELDVRNRRPGLEGDTQWFKARVTAKRVEGNEHLIECDIWAENQRGETTTTGTAIATLPSRG